MKQRNPQILAKSPLALAATALVASCLLSGNPAQAQVTISNIYPDGVYQFESSPTLSFNVSSPAGIANTNVSVVLTTTYIQNGVSFFRTVTSANGLGISGPATNLTVTMSLASNTLFKAVISATDAASSTASTTVNFDTLDATAFTWEAEDYDYTSNSVTGLFIDNPQTNLYAHLGATLGTDFNHSQTAGGGSYRPINGAASATTNTPPYGCNTEGSNDKPRRQYGNNPGSQGYDLGFNNGGDFANYTRHYPAGTYNVYLRGADGNSARQLDAASMTVAGGTVTLTSAAAGPFQFSVIGSGGWQTWIWCPLHDSAGNLAQLTVPNDGAASTLKVTIDGGNCNENDYLLLPVTTLPVSTASISNLVPDGSALFQSSNTFSFNVGAPDGVSPGDITLILSGVNLFGHSFSTNLTAANGLTINGPSTNLLVSYPLTTNTVYSAFIQAFDAHGVPTSTSLTFDTVVPFYTWEAEDFDYGGGFFFDNPQTNAYTMLDGITNVDYHGGGNGSYLRAGLTTEGCGDKRRPLSFDYTNTFDYDVGFNNGGNWGNYTRHYSNGTFNIYVRASDGGGSGSSDSGSFSLVTGGLGTTSQTVVKLGNWGVQPTGGWQTYTYVPVKDPAGNLVQFTGNGSVQTLRMTIDNGNCNENFFMLSPADPNVVLLPYVDNFSPDGTKMFQPSNTVSFIVHSQPGTATSNIVLSLNGSVVPTASMTFSGTPNFRTVNYSPLALNTLYTAVVTAADANGVISITNTFGTFSSTNYQLETEDYDYTSNGVSALFFDNSSGLDAYQGLSPASGIDCFESDANGANGSFAYRPSPAGFLAVPCETGDTAGDLPRPQMTSGGGSGTDWNVQYFGPNTWANYTRHYPWGTYGVIARTAEGNNPTHDTLWMVTSGVGTSNQTLSPRLGTFNIPLSGWASWRWSSMVDGSGNPARVVFPTNGTTTLRLGGVPNAAEDEANVNFLMLVKITPSPQLAAAVASGLDSISFPTEMGYNYQVQYKNNLTDPTWTNLGAVVAGDWTTHSVQDPSPISAHSTRFYRVQVQ